MKIVIEKFVIEKLFSDRTFFTNSSGITWASINCAKEYDSKDQAIYDLKHNPLITETRVKITSIYVLD